MHFATVGSDTSHFFGDYAFVSGTSGRTFEIWDVSGLAGQPARAPERVAWYDDRTDARPERPHVEGVTSHDTFPQNVEATADGRHAYLGGETIWCGDAAIVRIFDTARIPDVGETPRRLSEVGTMRLPASGVLCAHRNADGSTPDLENRHGDTQLLCEGTWTALADGGEDALRRGEAHVYASDIVNGLYVAAPRRRRTRPRESLERGLQEAALLCFKER